MTSASRASAVIRVMRDTFFFWACRAGACDLVNYFTSASRASLEACVTSCDPAPRGGQAVATSRSGTVQRHDAASQVEPPGTRPSRPAQPHREPGLVGPGADRLGEVHVGVG